MHYLEITWTDKWLVYTTGLISLVTLFIAYMANRWAMGYWRRQKKEEINYQLQNLRYQNMLEAAKAAWGLLAFLSEKENGKNFLIYKGTKESPEIFFNIERGEKYLTSLSDMFYDKGHGIFLTKDTNQYIFHIRTNVYKILDKEKRQGILTGEVLIENPGLVDFFRNSYENVRGQIKKYVLEELKYNIEE